MSTRWSTRWIQIFLATVVLFVASSAHAHPFGGEMFSHRIRVIVSESHLTIDYIIAIPTRQLNREIQSTDSGAQKQFQAEKITSLRTGIAVRSNGQPVPLNAINLGEGHVRARPHSFLYELRLEGELPEGSHTLEVSNQNYPGEHAYFRTDLSLGPSLEARSSSLHVKQKDGSTQDQTGRWWMDENLRVFNLRFGPKPTRNPRRVALLTGLLGALVFGRFFLRKQRHAKEN